MKTECPQCNTIFSITEDQLALAEGMVRCGVCQHVFNAVVQDDLFVESASETESFVEEEYQQEVAADVLEDTPAEDTPVEDIAEEYEALAANEPREDEDWQQPRLATPADDAGLFDTGDGYVVPEEIRYQDSRPSLLATTMWSLGAIALLGVLLAQLAWVERDTLMRSELVRPYLDQICEQADCSRLGLRAPDLVEMTSRNVYTHPTVDDALMVSLAIVNRANFTQPYPDIRIHFSDVIGNVIATRRFSPQEYLAIDSSDLKQLEPAAPVSFGIEIRDPGDRALTYEFEFL